MAYIRTILKGSIGTSEVWSTSTNWGIFGGAPDVPNQAWTDGILAKLIAFSVPGNLPTNLRASIGSTVSLDGWRVELRGENERILNISEGLNAAPINGSAGVTKTPQDAWVLSLRTNTPGARGRGRMYWPALSVGLNSSFQMSTPTSAQLVADSRTWLNAIGTQINAYFISISSILRVVLSVRSVVDHVCRDVNLLQVGSILDTQRRRRNNLPESYSPVAYP